MPGAMGRSLPAAFHPKDAAAAPDNDKHTEVWYTGTKATAGLMGWVCSSAAEARPSWRGPLPAP
jgi:hypothetical protein